MKTIEERAEEYAKKYIGHELIYHEIVGAIYLAHCEGAKSERAEWEEKIRWKSTKIEPPIIGQRVEIKNNLVDAYYIRIEDELDLRYIALTYTYWREIIE